MFTSLLFADRRAMVSANAMLAIAIITTLTAGFAVGCDTTQPESPQDNSARTISSVQHESTECSSAKAELATAKKEADGLLGYSKDTSLVQFVSVARLRLGATVACPQPDGSTLGMLKVKCLEQVIGAAKAHFAAEREAARTAELEKSEGAQRAEALNKACISDLERFRLAPEAGSWTRQNGTDSEFDADLAAVETFEVIDKLRHRCGSLIEDAPDSADLLAAIRDAWRHAAVDMLKADWPVLVDQLCVEQGCKFRPRFKVLIELQQSLAEDGTPLAAISANAYWVKHRFGELLEESMKEMDSINGEIVAMIGDEAAYMREYRKVIPGSNETIDTLRDTELEQWSLIAEAFCWLDTATIDPSLAQFVPKHKLPARHRRLECDELR